MRSWLLYSKGKQRWDKSFQNGNSELSNILEVVPVKLDYWKGHSYSQEGDE